MDALDVLKVCLRRWYVVLPVVLLSLAAGLGLASQQKPTYTAVGSYALVYHSPTQLKEGEDPTEPNPLATDGAVVLGEALVADFMSGASQTTFGGVGNSGTAPREATDGTSYTVDLPDGSQSYVVQTWGKDPESLRRVIDSVLAAAPGRAAQIQGRAGAPKKSQYTTFVTGSTQLTRLPSTSTTKLIVAMLGVGILAGSALSLVVDRLARSRKDRAAKRVPQGRQRSVDRVPPDEDGSDVVTQFPTSSAAPAQPYENEPEPAAAATVDLEPEEVHADGDRLRMCLWPTPRRCRRTRPLMCPSKYSGIACGPGGGSNTWRDSPKCRVDHADQLPPRRSRRPIARQPRKRRAASRAGAPTAHGVHGRARFRPRQP